MELEELIQELDDLVGQADFAADAGDADEAKKKLRNAKELLEVEFLAE